jgi:polyhydroxyalkanoate synthesis repressor PhaR
VTTTNKPTVANGSRLIKKYPNRRLYDTETSSYVTLSQVKELVVSGAHIQVLDAKTDADITRSILLQIILEEEAGGAPMFTEAVLTHIIRFYGNTMQSFLGPFIEHNMQSFSEMQKHVSEKAGGLSPDVWTKVLENSSPLSKGLMGNYVEQTQGLLLQMQENFAKQTSELFGPFGRKK